jgi:hypothetical protein
VKKDAPAQEHQGLCLLRLQSRRKTYSLCGGWPQIWVTRIIDRWYGVDHDYFKALADDGRIYLLKWDRTADLWFLVEVMEKEGKH